MYLLAEKEYRRVLPLLEGVKSNTLFAQSVLLNHLKGEVFADSRETPHTAYIRHPYGMSLVAGESNNKEILRTLFEKITSIKRDKFEWILFTSEKTASDSEEFLKDRLVIADENKEYTGEDNLLHIDKITRYGRINFTFDRQKFEARSIKALDYPIVQTDSEIFKEFTGTVVPARFWNTGGEFLQKGVGYTVMASGEPASMAFSACAVGNERELGIETKSGYRGKGFALAAAAHLIDTCLKRNLTPVWSCLSGNYASKNLAIKLGFVETLRLPYYRYPVTENITPL